MSKLTSTSVLPNMWIRTTADQILIVRIPQAMRVYPLTMKLDVKTSTNVTLTAKMTVTPGPSVPT